MVYLGPSRGCETCKRRRKKCDKARPSCLRCQNSNRTCAGYQEQASQTLIFQRNYTETITATDYWAGVKPLARKCSLPVRAPYPGTDTLPDDAAPKEVSEEDVVEYAVRGFFYDFSVSSQDSISASVGFLNDLEMQVKRKGMDSVLANACTMISYASNAKKLYRPSFITKAEVLYHELLRYLAEEIARSGLVGERSEPVQLAWLMGLYEVVMADETRLEQIDVHVRGIAGMLQIQNSPLGFIRGVFSCNSLDPGTQMKDPGLVRLPHWASNLGLLHDILLDIYSLRLEGEQVLANSTSTESRQHALLQLAAILNDRLARWEESLSPESKPTTIGHVRASSNPYIEVGHWPGPLHMYTDIRAAAILNVSRVAQCYLLDISFRLKLIQAGVEDNDQERLKATQLIQDFTSSIAYHLVEDLYSFSATVQRGNPIDQPGRAAGGLLLMYPLYIASQLSTVPLELQDYFKRCLVWIGQNMGIGYASLLAKAHFHIDDLTAACMIVYGGLL
ncbi:transcriptional regulatory protein moc3 [Aspergillus lentulus]|uniref:Transcriptional regulatory protein moc3 n=1 Tax=Aspergillus lentulus TaxID=293939 RepID=A0ABQ1AL89_ASPLE|nr:transcriptional regulatory protein moc3 [Aspergillus lentulus]GFF40969.1 transcriptional regulatory protein moc3 [Aspergillus lentulus]GFF83981.1 transcriptional regulatory protein moc3 [Aspergillus lentulus]GFF87384.1 Transcriptional regulatory protein moc3 [Aspergillus lentulus]